MKRNVILKKGKEILSDDVNKLLSIAKRAHKKEMLELMYSGVDSILKLANCYYGTIKQMNLLMGEDWYLLFFEDDFTIFASDFARIEPESSKDRTSQQRELEDAFMFLLSQCITQHDGKIKIKEIATELREDTSYILFLMKKRHCVVEQVHDEEARNWDCTKFYDVTEEDQQNLLKNRMMHRDEFGKDIIMHTVWFRPTQKTVDKILKNRKSSENVIE